MAEPHADAEHAAMEPGAGEAAAHGDHAGHVHGRDGAERSRDCSDMSTRPQCVAVRDDCQSITPRKTAASAVTPLSAPKTASPARDRARAWTSADAPDALTTPSFAINVVP